MGRVGQEVKKNNLRSKDDVWTVVLSESPWTANRRSQHEISTSRSRAIDRKQRQQYNDNDTVQYNSDDYDRKWK